MPAKERPIIDYIESPPDGYTNILIQNLQDESDSQHLTVQSKIVSEKLEEHPVIVIEALCWLDARRISIERKNGVFNGTHTILYPDRIAKKEKAA